MVTTHIESSTHDILSLLAYVVMADHEVHPQEINSFLDAALELNLNDNTGLELSRAWLFDWFLQNYENIKQNSHPSGSDADIVRLFLRLQSWERKKELLNSAIKIAVSDDDYHLNEKVLITLAAAYWDMKVPPLK